MTGERQPLQPVTLAGRRATLVPLTEEHASELYAVSQDLEIWLYMLYEMPRSIADMQAQIDDALALQARGEVLPFAIVDADSGRAIGSTRYMDVSMRDRHVEIGSTWLGRAYWRTPINTECKYLLLTYAFETLGCIRVQLKTDLRNERSQEAIERLGAAREGVLRRNMIVKGYQRSSVYYSILEDEWPAAKARLEGLLARSPATA